MAGEGQFKPAQYKGGKKRGERKKRRGQNANRNSKNFVGTWQSQAGEVKTAVSYALQNGYKLIDGAYCYGNEDEVGEGLKEAFAAGVKREDVFVVTKVWATYNTRVAEALDKSLKSLGLEYVDLLLVVSLDHFYSRIPWLRAC